MWELMVLLGIVAMIGIAVLLFKLLFFFILLPLKIGLGLGKLIFAFLIGIPVLIVGAVLLGVALPVLLVVIPILFVIALPFIIVFKLVF